MSSKKLQIFTILSPAHSPADVQYSVFAI